MNFCFVSTEIITKYQDDVLFGNNGAVLICPDNILETLNKKIYNADCLIHYNLPQNVKTFRHRFSVLLHRVQKRIDQVTDPPIDLFVSHFNSKFIISVSCSRVHRSFRQTYPTKILKNLSFVVSWAILSINFHVSWI